MKNTKKLYRYIINNCLSFFKVTENSETEMKLIIINSLAFLGSFYLLFMSFILIMEKSYFYSSLNLITLFFTVFLIILIKRSENYKIITTIYIIFLQFFFIFNFHTGAGSQMAFVWYFLYPLISFIVLGLYPGLVLSLNLIFISFILNTFNFNIDGLVYFPPEKMLRIIVSYSGVLLFTFIYEKNRLALQKKLENTLKELNELVIKDSLTGLYNRRYMDEVISRLINQCQRSQMNLGFIMADLDYFKNYNDTYGHQAGDSMILDFSKILKTIIKRKTDFVFRYGGEEFLIILSSTSSKSVKEISAAIVAETENLSVENIESPYDIVTVSAGAIFTDSPHEKSLQDLIYLTDLALYDAKKNGKNCYVFKNINEFVTN